MSERVCVAYRCNERARRGPLCPTHKRRLDRGGGLPTAGELFPGDVSGFGQFGVVDRDDTGVLCHECGQRYASLGVHIRKTHGIDVRQYRRVHGLRSSQSLALPPRDDGQPRRRPRPCYRCGSPQTTPSKLCPPCGQERRAELEARRTRPSPCPKPARWRALTATESIQLQRADQDELRALVPALQQSRVPSKVIAVALGRTPGWMTKHFPRSGSSHAAIG